MNSYRRLRLPATETSIRISRVSAVKTSGRVVCGELLKNEGTWSEALAHYDATQDSIQKTDKLSLTLGGGTEGASYIIRGPAAIARLPTSSGTATASRSTGTGSTTTGTGTTPLSSQISSFSLASGGGVLFLIESIVKPNFWIF